MKSSLLLSLLLFAGTTGAFSDTIFISPSTQGVSPGQIFAVDINIDNIPDLYDYQFSLSFDPAVLAADSITEGALFANTGDSFFSAGTIDNSAGSITLTFDTLLGPVPGVSGPGTIAVVDFSALATGTSSIDFSPLGDLLLQDSLGNALSVTPVSGTADIATPEPATISLLAAGIGLVLFGAWKRFPRKQKVMACATLTLAALCAAGARADTITTFDATGTFNDGASLSGTLTIDTTNGNVVASTVEALPDASGLTDIFVGTIGGVTGVTLEAPAGEPSLILDLSLNTLAGYTGGPLASLSDPATVRGMDVETTLFLPSFTAVFLSSGSLTPQTATPEAATFGMIAAGLGLIIIKLRRKHWAFIPAAA
jgi:hypothetical protein